MANRLPYICFINAACSLMCRYWVARWCSGTFCVEFAYFPCVSVSTKYSHNPKTAANCGGGRGHSQSVTVKEHACSVNPPCMTKGCASFRWAVYALSGVQRPLQADCVFFSCSTCRIQQVHSGAFSCVAVPLPGVSVPSL